MITIIYIYYYIIILTSWLARHPKGCHWKINNIFVFDRGYYSNDFIKNIYKTNNFFICRLKQKLQSYDVNIYN
jgi:hypothetical protein